MKLNYFNFKAMKDKVLLTNDLGKHVFIDRCDFKKLISKDIDLESDVGKKLTSTGMVYGGSDIHFTEVNEYRIRAVKSHMATATSLHIFVVTTMCNMNCLYCQANNGKSTPNCFMSEEIAKKAVDIALQSPEKCLSFEFQGGEPLLNFPIIKYITEYAESINEYHIIEYNLVSNLTLLTDEMLDFFEEHNFSISTSIDGNVELHNTNRPLKDGTGSFEKCIEGVHRIKERGLPIGAIQTTTRYSLDNAKQIVNTYVEEGFSSIFIRHLTQLGKAGKGWKNIGYSAEEFLDFYKEVIDTLIQLNKDGVNVREQHASIFLKRINGKRMNYMELRSPCGGGIGQLAYFADGRIFTCDEGRMLAEMGIDSFQLGDVRNDNYESLIRNGSCKTVCAASMLETIPTCCDCVYQPYCGTCPVVNYALNEDVLEKQPRSFRCEVYRGILDYLFELILENDEETIKVLNRWSE